MGPIKHLTCGLILGTGILISEKDIMKAASCVCGATMSDIDHIIEYAKYCKDYDVKPTFPEWKSGNYFTKKGTIYVIFHSWELCAIMWFISGTIKDVKINSIINGLTLGYTSHLILDHIGNNLNNMGYFWLYRWWKKYRQDVLLERENECEE